APSEDHGHQHRYQSHLELPSHPSKQRRRERIGRTSRFNAGARPGAAARVARVRKSSNSRRIATEIAGESPPGRGCRSRHPRELYMRERGAAEVLIGAWIAAGVVTSWFDVARAAEECHAAPKGPAPAGEHWY